MTLGLRCYSPACRLHPASLLVRVPAAKSSLPVLSACALRLWPNLPLRLASSPPSGSFHPDSSQHLPSTLAQVSKPAVSPISKSAIMQIPFAAGLETRDTAHMEFCSAIALLQAFPNQPP